MATLEVKGVDKRLIKALGARATSDKRSVSEEVVTMICASLAHPSRSPGEATRALLELAGSWKDERSARRIASDIRKARRSGRRLRKLSDVSN